MYFLRLDRGRVGVHFVDLVCHKCAKMALTNYWNLCKRVVVSQRYFLHIGKKVVGSNEFFFDQGMKIN